MLPKFRPAQVGNVLARPSIRPVKPTRPPPPPTPPRRRPSGITAKNERAPEVPALYEEDDEEDVATRVGNFRELDEDPPTEAAVTRPRVGAPETVRYDEETKALPVDERLRQHARSPRDPYEALPSLEVQRVDDDYEREFAERYPYEAGADAPTNRNVEYAVSSDDFLQSEPKPEPAPRTVRGVTPDPSGSGARPRVDTAIFDDDGPGGQEHWQMESSVIVNHGSQASHPPAPMFPPLPPPAPVPHDAFIVGVQPLRSGFTPGESFAPMMPMAQTAPPPAYPQPMPTAAASPRAMHHQHQQLQMQMQVAPPPVWQQQPRAPLAQQVTQPARQGSFRFLWFVVGAVFGIAAFFGASSAAYKYSQQPAFPPAAPLPTVTATAPTVATAPPAAVTAPAPTTVAADPKPTDAKPSETKPADAKTTATTTVATPPATPAKKSVAAAPAPPPRTNGRGPRPMYTGSNPPSAGDEGGGASFGGGGGGAAPAKGGNVPSMSGDVFGAALSD